MKRKSSIRIKKGPIKLVGGLRRSQQIRTEDASRALRLGSMLLNEHPAIEKLLQTKTPRSRSQVVSEFKKRLRDPSQQTVRMLLTYQEWLLVSSKSDWDAPVNLVSCSDLGPITPVRLLRCIHQYDRKRKRSFTRAYLEKHKSILPQPTKSSFYTNKEDARSAQKKMQLEDGDRIFALADSGVGIEGSVTYRIDEWEPMTFLKAHMPWMNPSEIVYKLIRHYADNENHLFGEDWKRWGGGGRNKQAFSKNGEIICAKYEELIQLPENADISKRTYFLSHILLPSLKKQGTPFSLRTIQKYTKGFPWKSGKDQKKKKKIA